MLAIWDSNLAFNDKDLATYLYNFPIYLKKKKTNSADYDDFSEDDAVADFDLPLVLDVPVDPVDGNSDFSNKTLNATVSETGTPSNSNNRTFSVTPTASNEAESQQEKTNITTLSASSTLSATPTASNDGDEQQETSNSTITGKQQKYYPK